jgi:hypothetical protein
MGGEEQREQTLEETLDSDSVDSVAILVSE